MKSTILGIALSLFATSAFAGWMEVKDMEPYKTALIAAYNAHSTNWVCSGTRMENGKTSTTVDVRLENLVMIISRQITGMWMDSDRAQPLLFIKYFAASGSVGDLYVYTDETRTQITKLGIVEGRENKSMKNVGTIDNPIYEEVVVMDPVMRATCH